MKNQLSDEWENKCMIQVVLKVQSEIPWSKEKTAMKALEAIGNKYKALSRDSSPKALISLTDTREKPFVEWKYIRKTIYFNIWQSC